MRPPKTVHSVKNALSDAVLQLTTDDPRMDAEVLLAHTLNVPRSWLSAHPEAQIVPFQYTSYKHYVGEVSRGAPLPYVIGHWEFYGLDFKLDARALIPRPETELLVEQALHHHITSRTDISIADIGTGNGIIAITLALKLPNAKITATDISSTALELAHENAVKHDVANRIAFTHSDLLEGLDRFELICSNPPYISTDQLETLPVARHEPRLALDGGEDGMEVIERLLTNAGNHLHHGGVLMLEIGADQGHASLALAEQAFSTGTAQIIKDMSGRDRLLIVSTQQGLG